MRVMKKSANFVVFQRRAASFAAELVPPILRLGLLLRPLPRPISPLPTASSDLRGSPVASQWRSGCGAGSAQPTARRGCARAGIVARTRAHYVLQALCLARQPLDPQRQRQSARLLLLFFLGFDLFHMRFERCWRTAADARAFLQWAVASSGEPFFAEGYRALDFF